MTTTVPVGPTGGSGTDGTAVDNGLKAGSFGLVGGVVVGMASTAPAYSLAAGLGFIVASGGAILAGVRAPAIMHTAWLRRAGHRHRPGSVQPASRTTRDRHRNRATVRQAIAMSQARKDCSAVLREPRPFLRWGVLVPVETLDLANEDGVMGSEVSPGKPTTRRYSPAEKEQAVRLVRALRAEFGTDQSTVHRVARQLGYGSESVRSWVRQADIRDGRTPGLPTTEATVVLNRRDFVEAAPIVQRLPNPAVFSFTPPLRRRSDGRSPPPFGHQRLVTPERCCHQPHRADGRVGSGMDGWVWTRPRWTSTS
jgi:transposase